MNYGVAHGNSNVVLKSLHKRDQYGRVFYLRE